jgi:hypothetical protein
MVVYEKIDDIIPTRDEVMKYNIKYLLLTYEINPRWIHAFKYTLAKIPIISKCLS